MLTMLSLPKEDCVKFEFCLCTIDIKQEYISTGLYQKYLPFRTIRVCRINKMRNNQFSVENHKVSPLHRGVAVLKISSFHLLQHTLCIQQFQNLFWGICCTY